MLIGLSKYGLNAESQKPITIYYKNEIIGEFIADIIDRIKNYLVNPVILSKNC